MTWRTSIGFTSGIVLALAASLALLGVDAPERAWAAEEKRAPALFVLTYRPGPSWQQGVAMGKQGLGPHGAYIKGLLESGQLFAGGGFVTSDGGMAIVYAASMDEARALLAADPAITSAIFVATVEEWRPRFHKQAPLIPVTLAVASGDGARLSHAPQRKDKRRA